MEPNELSTHSTICSDYTDAVIGTALFGRMCISAVFVVVILHTAELFPTTIRSSAIGTSSTMAHVGSISAPYIVDGLGALTWFIPSTICGACSILAGLLVLGLPETEHAELNETVEEETTREIKSVWILKELCCWGLILLVTWELFFPNTEPNLFYKVSKVRSDQLGQRENERDWNGMNELTRSLYQVSGHKRLEIRNVQSR